MNDQLARRGFLKCVSGAFVLAHGANAATNSATGHIATLAGTGQRGMAGEGDAAADAHIDNPYGLIEAPDRSSLYWVDNGSNRILRLDYHSKKISIVAGNGTKGYSGDGGPAKAAQMSQPHEIRFDGQGNLLVVERDSYAVRRIDLKSGIITNFAGIPGTKGFAGDGGPAAQAQFNQPHSIALDASGNVYVCDILNNRVRRIDAKTGIISTFAGNGEKARTPDEAPLAGTPLTGPRSLEITRAGKFYLALREGNAVFELDPKMGRLKRIAGTGESGYSGDGGPAAASRTNGPKGLCVSEDGRTMYVADTENHVIRRIDLRSGIISTAAGTGMRGDGSDGDPLKCALNRPHGLCLRNKVLYIGDSENHRIRTLTPA